MNKYKIAIIGCGRISYKHVEAIVNNSDEAELVAVCDIVESKAYEKEQLYKSLMIEKNVETKVSVYKEYREMLANEKIDIIVVASESGYHAEHTIHALQNNCHVIVEKPMALSTKDADDMIRIADEKGLKLCVCHQNRFNPPIQKLRKAIDKNAFGKIVNGTARILWNRNETYYKQAPWRGTWEQDGGTLMNQCIHNIDLLQWMVGSPVESVYSKAGTFLRDIEGEDFGALVIGFENDTIGIVEGTACVYPSNLEETLSIFGETGTVVIGGLAVNEIETWNFDDAEINKLGTNEESDIENVYGNGHTPLYKDFINAVNFDKLPLIHGKEGKKAMEIILAAYKSRKVNQVVKVDDNFEFSTLDMK